MTARIEQRRQTIEVVCFLHATLMELTDIAIAIEAKRCCGVICWHSALQAALPRGVWTPSLVRSQLPQDGPARHPYDAFTTN